MNRLKRWFFEVLRDFLLQHDHCEICSEFEPFYTCISCDRRYCVDCESGYYEDENLCSECRATITPEQEAEDWKEAVESEDYHGTIRGPNGEATR